MTPHHLKVMSKYLSIVIIYLLIWSITWPALLADYHARYPYNSAYNSWEVNDCKHQRGIEMILSLIPVFWVATPFYTGFYEYGFKFRCGSKEEEGI